MAELRKANTGDIAALTELRIQMLTEDGLPEALRETLRRNTAQYMRDGLADGSFRSWIAERDNHIIAMGGVNFFRLPPNDWCPEGSTAYIGNLFTLPAYRKQGIGKKLFALLVNEARSEGCERILLNASDMGKPLYEEAGFRDWPAAMVYYPQGIASEEDKE